MNDNNPITGKHFTIDELCKLVDLSKRTIRYYIQQGLVDSPDGEKRGSYYTTRHVESLLEIKKWQSAGLSLERIRQILDSNIDNLPLPPESQLQPGDISVWSRLYIDHGIELSVDSSRAELSPELLREFIKQINEIYKDLRK